MIRGILRTIIDPRIRPEWRWLILRRLARWLMPNYYPQRPELDWYRVEWFAEFLDKFQESDGLHANNRWNLYQLARVAAHVPGDTAECGVFRGAGSYLICRASSTPVRTHFVFDSFSGISSPSPADGTYWRTGDLTSTIQIAQDHLRGFNVSWHPGWIPQRFIDVEDRRFSFVHIDVDLEQPTRDSIEFFYPRLNPGGVLLCDDYGYAICPGATRAVDEFLADKPETLVALASGGGFILKR